MRESLTARLLTVTVLISAAAAAIAANTEFPLAITFEALAVSASGMTGDGTYIHRAEGRVPVVMMNRNGMIQMDTRGSSRTVCFYFGGASALDLPALAPADGCYTVLLRTLIRTDNVRVADLADGEMLAFGMDVYWTGHGKDGRLYDYVIEYKRVEGYGVNVTAGGGETPDTWTVSGDGPGKVSVYRKGKVAGWSVVGTYVMPVNFTAVRGN